MISQAILSTLAYSAHFGFPLTQEEIHSRLISIKISQIRLLSQIRQMLKDNLVSQTGIYYHLPGKKSSVTQRIEREKNSAHQLVRAQLLARKLGKTPGVLAIYLTGSLAMQNSTPDSDIDFMVITQNHRLWTTRFLLTLTTTILGLRRTPSSVHNSGKVCLNLYLTPNSYLIPKNKRSLYTAYELIQIVPLYDPHNTYANLISSNPWILGYLPNYQFPKKTKFRTLQNASVRNYLHYYLQELIEYFLFHLQLLYMRPKLTREYITPDSAFFHPHDPSPKL